MIFSIRITFNTIMLLHIGKNTLDIKTLLTPKAAIPFDDTKNQATVFFLKEFGGNRPRSSQKATKITRSSSFWAM